MHSADPVELRPSQFSTIYGAVLRVRAIINLAFERVSPTLWLWNTFDVFKCVHDNQIEILSAYCKR